jgi:insulysin
LKVLSNPKHPYSRFAAGNNLTLIEQPEAKGYDPRSELRRYHKTQYSANRMDLVVYADVDIMKMHQDDIMKLFMQITNKQL